MATSVKGKGTATNGSSSLSPRIVNGSMPRSPTSPRRSPSSSTHKSSHKNSMATSPSTTTYANLHPPASPSSSSSMNGLLPTVHQQQQSHHYSPYNNDQQQQRSGSSSTSHQQPPRFRQQQQHVVDSSSVNQYAQYPSPSAYSHTLSPLPSTSSLAPVAPTAGSSTTTTSGSRNTNHHSSSSSPNNGTSSSGAPTIASMQNNSHHYHHGKQQYQHHAGGGQGPSSTSASSHSHYPVASTSTNASTATSNSQQASTSSSHSPHYNSHHHSHNPSIRLPRPSETFTRELSNVLQHTFIPSILPSPEEYKVKENARKYLEYLADRITPGAKLLPFGSQANGLALRNSDMDLCYISPPGKPRKSPSELVELLGRMIEVEAPVFAVKMLSRARIPIIKLSPSPIYHLRRQEMENLQKNASATKDFDRGDDSSTANTSTQVDAAMRKVSSSSAPPSASTSRPGSSTRDLDKDATSQSACLSANQPNGASSSSIPTSSTSPASRWPEPNGKVPSPPPMPEYGLSCDIGFENRLALENTRLLLTYAMADPRLRTIVLFLKVWTKRRKINNSYLGTLSSYGYVLLVIHFLINARKPPVLPNLQRLRPPGMAPMGQTEFEGKDVYFFDDLELLPRYWQSTNRDNVGELLIAFFNYYHKEFRYTFDVVSIRSEGGIINKAAKGWMNDQPPPEATEATPGKETSTPGLNRNVPRDLNRLCIEDPFQTDYNVARTVTVDGLFTIRGEIARAVGILRGNRSDVNAVIAELLEEREDYLVQAPAPNTNRRRSAPSPRLQPSVLATHQDFRTWALANGVPHAQGGNMPMFSHQQQGGTSSLTDDLNNVQSNGLTSINAEALARYQQASQALSQANLQQQQAQQQQLLASLPALLAATTMRNTSRSTPRRFHEHSYKQLRQHQGIGNMQQQQTNVFGQQLLSPQQAQQLFQSSHVFQSPGQSQYAAANDAFSRSPGAAGSGGHHMRPPILERRSSWDGSAASDETRHQAHNRSGSSTKATGSNPTGAHSTSATAPIDTGTTTAPTSPAMHNGNLPAFASHGMYQRPPSTIASPTLSTVSIATAPAGSFNQYGTSQGADRQMRDHKNQWPHSSTFAQGRSSSHVSRQDGQQAKGPRHHRDEGSPVATGSSIPMQDYPTGLPMGQLRVVAGMPFGYRAQAEQGVYSSALSTTSTSVSVLGSPSVNMPISSSFDDRDPVIEDDSMPSPSSIRFGNFDAAFYSSEPTEMAGLGLFDASSSSDGSPLSFVGTPSLDDSTIPEEVALPPPVRLPPQQPANFAASMRAAQRFRPQLADIPASPAAKHVPSPMGQVDVDGSSSRRLSLQSNRRRSAGDEVGLGLGDVTFFGKIPVSKNEDEREKAMAALLKESGKDFKPSSLPSSSATSQSDSAHPEKSSTTVSIASSVPTNDSSAVSAPRAGPGKSPVVAGSSDVHSPSGKSAEVFTSPTPARTGPSYATLAGSRSTTTRK